MLVWLGELKNYKAEAEYCSLFEINGVFYGPFFAGAACSGCKLNHEILNFSTGTGVYVFRRTPGTAILISAREGDMPPRIHSIDISHP